jgi:hypothetical protein
MFNGTKRFSWSSGKRNSAARGALYSLGLATMLLLCSSFLLNTADAQDQNEAGAAGASRGIGDGPPNQRFYKPFYDKASGSYFQLIPAYKRMSWEIAREDAASHSYKGRVGRLAVIKSYKTHIDLLKHLSVDVIDNAWIGLQYLCGSRALAWTDGTYFRPGEFSNWSVHWANSDFSDDCTSGYMGVTLSPSEGLRWLAYEQQKGFDWYVVEYPAPAKKEKDAAVDPKVSGSSTAASQ